MRRWHTVRSATAPLLAAGVFASMLALPVVAAAAPGRTMIAEDEPVARAEARRAEAAERFDRGMTLLADGDNAGALAELTRVYEIAPHPQVLYNLGLVHAAMNHPVEAVRALDRVLAAPGPLSADRLARARRTRDEQARRVARLDVTTNVPAALEADGVAAGTTPLEAPLELAAGTHVIAAQGAGYLPVRKEVTLAGQARGALHLDLLPSELRLAHLTVRSPVPGAEVLVDGQPVGRTPLPGSVAVPPGKRAVELRRPGYRSARQEIALDDGAAGELAVDLQEDDAASARAGRLALAVSEPDPEVTVDGKPRGAYRGPLRLPAGVHELRVARAGFLPAERTVVVPAGADAEAQVTVTLIPTPETRAAYKQRAEARRTWGWVATLGGAALAGGAAALVAWNRGPLGDARAEYARVSSECPLTITGSPAYEQCQRDTPAATDELNRRQDLQTAGILGAAVGVAALASGVVLLAGGDDPDRYDRVPRDADRLAAAPKAGAAATVAVQPWLAASAAAGGITLRGGF